MRRTKIVVTLGPSTEGRVGDLVEAGVDIVRINFSHGSKEQRSRAVGETRRASIQGGRPVGVLADLSGPKVRLGQISGGETTLEAGASFELRPRSDAPGDSGGAPVDHSGLHEDVQEGDRLLLADGAVELIVRERREAITAEIIRGGTVRSRAGVNVPAERLSLPPVTDKDRQDLEEAFQLGADFLAQSFVRKAADVEELKDLIQEAPTRLVAKIETRGAAEDSEAIMEVADAIMIARGDLGVEIPYEEIPVIQKDLVRQAGEAGVSSIVATQILESMIHAPRPTRAEASDVANIVLDGADAVLLSGETAIGEFPVEAVRAAGRIAQVAEEKGVTHIWEQRQPRPESEPQAIAQAAASLTHRDHEIRAIACFTHSGTTAELLSAVRPRVPVFAYSDEEATVRALSLRRAVIPGYCEYPKNTDDMIAMMDRRLREAGLHDGDLVLMVASTPLGSAPTNLLKIHRL